MRGKVIIRLSIIVFILLILFSSGKGQDINWFPTKVCGQDSLIQMSKLKGKWKCINYRFCRVSTGDPIIRNPQFIVGDTSYIIRDTFVNYRCDVEIVKNVYYLYEMYEFEKVDTNAVAYRFSFRTKELPISVKKDCHNPYYELANEFIIYKNNIYYNLNGVIYIFKKI